MTDTIVAAAAKASQKTKIAGVMGWPISHSKSPRLHGFWLRQLGLDGDYVPLAIPKENLADELRALAPHGFSGVNLTVPHKEASFAIVDDVEPLARRIGAINTVIVQPDGRLIGRNTDAYGFITNLTRGAPRYAPKAGAAVVLGAGGAARAVCAALLDAGCPEIRLTNRNRDRADLLARDLGGLITVEDWGDRERILADAALVVNTTTLGMQGQAPLDIDLAALPAAAVVHDIVYAPLETPLLADARRRGFAVVDGIGMLLYQAQPAFAAWFGITPEVTPALRDHVLGLT